MSTTLDVYRDWLGIKETTRPLDNYQLLRLKRFEDDQAKIRENYRKMNAHVRKYAAGDFAKQSQDLLNELSKSMLCLTDSRRKAEYDASLGRKSAGEGKTRSMEEILLGAKVVDTAQLAKARNYSNAVGVPIQEALVQQKIAKAEAIMPAFAESIGLPFLDLQDLVIDERLFSRVPALIARQHSCAPVLFDQNQLLIASPNPLDPNVEDELRLRLNGVTIRSVICTPAAINALITKYYGKDAVSGDGLPPAIEQAGQAGLPPAAAKKEAKERKSDRTPEEAKKHRLIVSFMAANFVFMVPQFYSITMGSGSPPWLLSIFLWLVVGGATYGIMAMMDK